MNHAPKFGVSQRKVAQSDLYVVPNTRPAVTMPDIQREIFRRWLQGRSERDLRVSFGVTREGIEAALKVQAREMMAELRELRRVVSIDRRAA